MANTTPQTNSMLGDYTRSQNPRLAMGGQGGGALDDVGRLAMSILQSQGGMQGGPNGTMNENWGQAGPGNPLAPLIQQMRLQQGFGPWSEGPVPTQMGSGPGIGGPPQAGGPPVQRSGAPSPALMKLLQLFQQAQQQRKQQMMQQKLSRLF